MSSAAFGSPRPFNGTSNRPNSARSSQTRPRTPSEDLALSPTPSDGAKEVTPPPLSVSFEAVEHSNSVLTTLNDLRMHAELCDIVLKAGNREFSAHRAVLCANSPYFRAMLTNSGYTEAEQRTIELHGITPEALESLLQYFYTSQLHISTSNVQEILPVAGMFQVTLVKDACCEFMKRHLGSRNCLGICAFADAHSCPQLKRLAETFIKQHLEDVVQSEEFLKLQLDQVTELFSANDLNVASEEKVFEAVMMWIKYDPASREKYIADLLEKIRLPLLAPQFLCDHVGQEGIVQSSPRAVGLLVEAMEYHLLPERRGSLTGTRNRPRDATSRVEVLLAVGGMGRRGPTPSIERYHPHLKQWKSLSPMGTSRWGAGVATLDNMVYVVGGSNERSRLGTAERYDVSQDQWSQIRGMSVARNGVGVVITGGFLYAIGGFDGVSPLKSGERYDPQSNKWTSIPDMTSKRFGLGTCACEGLIYAVGGSDGTKFNLNTGERYNTSTKTWSPIAPMHICRKFPGVEALGGTVYAIGGCEATTRHASVERYIPGLNQWTTVASLLCPRSGLGTAVLDGFLYVAGGQDGTTYLSSMERYDPLTNQWYPAPSMSTSRDCVGVTVVELQQPIRAESPSGGSESRSSSRQGHREQQ